MVATRTVSYDGTHVALTKTYTYQTTWPNYTGSDWSSKATTVTTTDTLHNIVSTTIYKYTPYILPQQPYVTLLAVARQMPLESEIDTYDGSNISTPISTEYKGWINPNYLACDTWTTSSGLTRSKFFQYNFGQISDIKEYSYGQISATACSSTSTAAPSTPMPARETTTTFQSFSNPQGSLFGEPQNIIVYGNGTKLSETDYAYDGSTLAPLAAVSHDDALLPATVTTGRGNLTSVTKRCLSGCASDSVTTISYDQTGQVSQVIDSCGSISCTDMRSAGTGTGHATTYSFLDAYDADGTSPGQTNARLTQVTRPVTNGATHTSSYTYRYGDGQLSTATDENSQTTSYTYDSYNRLTMVQDPVDLNNGGNRGSTTYSYSPAGSPPSVTKTQQINTAGLSKTDVSLTDGMGHVIRTERSNSLGGYDLIDTTYDSSGNIASVTNPYRFTLNGVTSFTYDALGRKVAQTQPDSATIQWCYEKWQVTGRGACSANLSSIANTSWTDLTDEGGHHSQQVSDGLGRLAGVMEPDPITGSPSLETDYTYDALNNLIHVNQKGAAGDTARVRTFAYDSLSRLTTSLNPETGTVAVCYGQWSGANCINGYDGNGNLALKTDSRGLTTAYTYDTLNRLLSKTYPAGTPSSCYQYDASSLASSGGNLVGRLTNSWTQSGSCPSSAPPFQSSSILTRRSILAYDAMGRVLNEQQCTLSNCATAASYAPAYDYDLAGNMVHHSNGTGMTFTNCYDAAGHLSLVVATSTPCSSPAYTSAAQLFTAPVYSPAGAITSASYGLGLGVTRTYDNRLRITGEIDTGNKGTLTGGTATINIGGAEQIR